MADDATDTGGLSETFDGLALRQRDLEVGANSFARAMTGAFARSVAGGRALDDVLKSLYLRMSDLSLRLALAPVTRGIAGGLSQLFTGLFGSPGETAKHAMGAIKPFAAGGVIGTPTYFPLMAGGLGLAGEAGPEAIVPLARGADGRLGVAMTGAAAPTHVTINIATPDAESFRRSEVFITGQIARAVARGQRGM